MSWKLFDKCTQDSGLVATGSPKIPNRIGYRLIAETDATCFVFQLLIIFPLCYFLNTLFVSTPLHACIAAKNPSS